MKRLYLLVALVAVLGYVGWRTGVVRWPGQTRADGGRRARPGRRRTAINRS